ncbi:slit homolog 1 protein-like isoform X1 [Scylla paramamosain]|uniref:slit homolog 1 protein-like isoform X1 n=1 Tax=Scylla paramamosain TaxID=85552 RepID=UPI003083E78D
MMILDTIIFIMASVLQTEGASEPPTQCPHWCACEASTALCEGGGILQMEPKIKTFNLNNANPPIPELSPMITKHLQHMVSLGFNAAGLTTIQPEALKVMEHLEELSLTNNNISVIYNNTFVYCPTLVDLNLDNNNILIIHEGSFTSLHRLQKLSLSHNNLITIPTSLPPYLQFLSVHHNLLPEAPQLKLNYLTNLNLCYNLIRHINPKQINLKSLKDLCLGGRKFNLNARLFTQEQFPILRSLHLKGTSQQYLDIPDKALRNIQNMSTTSLTTLELDFCSIASLTAFEDMSTLHTLRMTNIILISTRMFTPILKLPLITVLDFSGSPGLAQSFLDSPPTRILNSLKILRMPRCGITRLPQSLQNHKLPNITHLDISFNPLKCTCDLSWIPDHVREGKLVLENEEYTICAYPEHLQNITLLTATLCPILRTLSTITLPELTVSTHITPTSFLNTTYTNIQTTSTLQVFPEWSTESSGESSKTNAPHNNSTLNRAAMGFSVEKILGIFGAIAVSIIVAYLLVILSRNILNHYRTRNFNVCDAQYNSQQQLTLHAI